MKKAVFEGNAIEEIRAFPQATKLLLGEEIMRLQDGLNPTDSKPMSIIGAGVREIRIKAGNQYRAIYVAKFEEAIYILSAFEKKTQKTPKKEIDKAKARYSDLLNKRKKQ